MGNWRMEWGKCGEQGWENKEWDGNTGAENPRGNVGKLGGDAKNVVNQGGDAANQCGNASIATETK